jgi:RNA polymerase sigma factor (sigma-70 family)
MRSDDRTLARLMALAQAGDRVAYGVLLRECRTWLARYFSQRVPPHSLDDLIQETLVSVHRKRASYDPARPFLPWLAVIGRNRWVDHLRKAYRRAEDEPDANLSGANEEPAIVARLTLDRLLDRLSEGQSRAIRLVKIEGLTIDEASQASGQSEALVKVNIHRGLRRLAAMIESD